MLALSTVTLGRCMIHGMRQLTALLETKTAKLVLLLDGVELLSFIFISGCRPHHEWRFRGDTVERSQIHDKNTECPAVSVPRRLFGVYDL